MKANWTNDLTNWQPTSLQSLFSDLKKKYKGFNTLNDQSGFGWDEYKCIPTVDESTWDAYVRNNS